MVLDVQKGFLHSDRLTSVFDGHVSVKKVVYFRNTGGQA